jgi:very-short-patch-repair endonuclease
MDVRRLLQLVENAPPASRVEEVDYPTYVETRPERYLHEALRFSGITVERQVAIGNFRVNMLLSSYRSRLKVILECDLNSRHPLIQDFRDDELASLTKHPIAHIYAEPLMQSPEHCAAQIVERFFPEHQNIIGYCEASIKAEEEGLGYTPGAAHFSLVGYDRPDSHGRVVTPYSDAERRDLARRLVKLNYGSRRITLAALAYAYILEFYTDKRQAEEFERLDQYYVALGRRVA